MLTRFVRIQLIIFTIASVIGVFTMVVVYMQAPTLLNIGRMKVVVELPGTGGLYRFSNVTYRGVQIGKVTEVIPTRGGAEATLSLDTSYDIPADVHAEVRSVSAVGEQYLDLLPQGASSDPTGPRLRNGSVIPRDNTSIPQAVGPMLDQISSLLDSVPKDRIGDLLDESFKGLNGSGFDLGSLMDSGAKVIGDSNDAADQMRSLIDDSRPLLDGQQQSIDDIKTWAGSLARITERVAVNDAHVRTILEVGPGAADEASALLNQVKPTLPVLMANMTTVGQVAVTYHASIEQLLVLLPPYVAATQTVGVARNNPTGMAMGDFTLSMNDPPACTVGFLPPSSWRSPADLSDVDTPDGLYCKLPQDSPIGVRGARNYPCMGQPGKRAPTVEMCESDMPYEPLAMRQHVLGPYPIDPNLIAQGVAPDDRVNTGEHIYGPVEGTPPGVAPSSSSTGGSDGPSVAIATYDPETGRYATPDGKVYRQADLATPAGTWEDLLPK
jgi:phospholipid/cholesterol/gamma-HCH transport system substrate-binding protein